MRSPERQVSAGLPGAELIERGLADLARGRETVGALLVSIAAPRLRASGFAVSSPIENADLRLYHQLGTEFGNGAHSRYNALLRRLVSFQRAAACEVANRDRVDRFLHALAREATTDTRIFLVGGTSAVLIGWRDPTVDVDLVMRPESDALLRAIPILKGRLNINVELASPDQFMPVPPGWEDRSPFVSRIGHLTIRHYDFVAQALSKIERGHTRDLADVQAMKERGLITPSQVRDQFARIEPDLYRFPAIDPASFREAIDEVFPPSR